VDTVRLVVHKSQQVILLTTIGRELHHSPVRTLLVPQHPRLQRLALDALHGVCNAQWWLTNQLLLLLLHCRVARPAVKAVRCCWDHRPLRTSPRLHGCWHLLLQLLLCLPLLLKQDSCHAAWGSTADGSKPSGRTLQRLLLRRLCAACHSGRHSHPLILWQHPACPFIIIPGACAGAGALPLNWLLLLVPWRADDVCVHCDRLALGRDKGREGIAVLGGSANHILHSLPAQAAPALRQRPRREESLKGLCSCVTQLAGRGVVETPLPLLPVLLLWRLLLLLLWRRLLLQWLLPGTLPVNALEHLV
jgi:hypothetical protein